jgi:hypothetical protein
MAYQEDVSAGQERLDAAAVRTPGDPAPRRMGALTRRRLLKWTGAGVAGGAALNYLDHSGVAQATTARSPGALAAGVPTTPGKVLLVPPPTGVSSTDTANILQALHAANGGTSVVLQWSPTAVYAIDQELPIPRGVRLTGNGASSQFVPGTGRPDTLPTLQQVLGVNLVCIAGSASFLDGLYGPANPGKYSAYNSLYDNGTPAHAVDSGIEVDHLAFDGQNGGTGTGNTKGHGLVMFSYGAKTHDCFLVNVANIGIWMADANYLGTGSSDENHENRIQDNTIINPGWYGIKVDNDYGGSGGSTDGHILNNLVWSPSHQRQVSGPQLNPISKRPYEGLRMENAAGWWIVNNHLVACPGDGAYFNTTGGLHLMHNTLDGFGCNPLPGTTYVGFNITTAGQTKLHPGRMIGNLAAAYEWSNPYAPATKPSSTNTYSYFVLAMQTDPGRLVQPTYTAYPTHSDNVAQQASQLPAPIAGASILTGNPKKVTVPQGSASAVAAGMAVTDSLGLIPKGAIVKSVTPGIGTSPDTIVLTAAGTPGSGDTLSFVGPTSVAWTYVNALPSSGMVVHRTNETATGTINPVPVITIKTTAGKPTPTVTLLDPASYVGGEFLDPRTPPVPGDLIVAGSAAGSTTWKTSIPGLTVDPTAGGALIGSFPNPWLSPDSVTTFTSSGSLVVPAWATRARITCVGGGGGGGGGLGGSNRQVGGAGGAAGSTAERVVDVTGSTTLTITVGAGGTGGAGAASGGTPGDGGAGGASLVTAGSVLVRAGGGAGGQGATSGLNPVSGAAFGAPQGVTALATLASGGGASGLPGGSPFAASPGGGGGGGSATALLGGTGGSAGTQDAGGAGGTMGGQPGTSGGAGGTAGSPGGPGGGGGAGAGAAGGPGGAGAPGYVIVQAIG